jgi:hypothetical protein
MLLPTGRTPYGVSDALGRQVEYSTAALNYVNGVYGPVNGDGSPAISRSAAWYNQIAADPTGKAYLDAAIKQAQQTQQQAQGQSTQQTPQTQTQQSAYTGSGNATPTGTVRTASLTGGLSLSQILAQSGIDLSSYHVTSSVDTIAATNDNKVKDSIKKSLATSSDQYVRDNADGIATAIARNVMNGALQSSNVSVTTVNPGKSDGDVILRTMSVPATESAPKNAVMFNSNLTALNSSVVVTTNANGQKVALIGSNPSQVAASKVQSSINPLSFVQEKTGTVSAIPMQTSNVQNMFVAAPTWLAQAAQKIATGASQPATATKTISFKSATPAAGATGLAALASTRTNATPQPMVTQKATPQVSASAPSWFSSAMASAAATGKIGK